MRKLIIVICVLIGQWSAKSQIRYDVGFGINTFTHTGGYFLNLGINKQIDGRYYIGTGIIVNNLFYSRNNYLDYFYDPQSYYSSYSVSFKSINYEIPINLKYDLVKNKLYLKSYLGLFVGDVYRYNYKFSSDEAEENYNRVNGLLWGKLRMSYGLGVEYWFLPRFGTNFDLGGLTSLDYNLLSLRLGLKYQFWQKEKS